MNSARRPARQPCHRARRSTRHRIALPTPRPASPVETLLELHRAPREGGALHLRAVGELDAATAPRLSALLDTALRDTARRADLGAVELDLTAVTFCSVAGMTAVLRAHERARVLDVALRVHASSPVARIAELCGQPHLHR